MKKEQEPHRHFLGNTWLKPAGFTICLLLLFSSPGNALWLGQGQVNPFLEVQERYETNVFRVSDDEEEDSDFVTVISPGIHVEFPSVKDADFRAIGNYRADLQLYGNDSDSEVDPEGELNTNAHRLDGQLLFNFASGLRFKTGYTLNITSAPPDFRGDTRDQYTEHEFIAQTAYAFADRYEIQLQYDGLLRSYDDTENEADDLTSHGIEATMFYQLFSKFSILGGGSYAMIDREEPTFFDSTEYTGFGGIRYEATERTTSILKVGAIFKDFDTELIDDATEVFASGELITELSDTTVLSLQLYRNISETSVSSESSANGAYYMTTGVGAQMTHTLTALPNLSFTGKFSYSNEDYPEDSSERSDDNLEVSVGADYKFLKYVTVGAHYTYSSTDSNIDTNDFTDNIAFINIRVLM